MPARWMPTPEFRRWVAAEHIGRKRRQARIDLRRGPGLRRERERRFVRAFVYGALELLVASNGRSPKSKAELLPVAQVAAAQAGYSRAQSKGAQLMSLERVRLAVHDEFERSGLSVHDCAQIISDIAKNQSEDADKRLRAIDMRVRMTFGYAPVHTRNVNLKGSIDKFFEAQNLDKTPPPNAEEFDAKT